MASCEVVDASLKLKINRIKHLLDDASKRFAEEYQIFATKSSAVPSTTTITTTTTSTTTNNLQNGNKNPPMDRIKLLSDIETLKSVLKCPIFEQIINVTESLDKLSHHVNLRPSLGPNEIDIDPASGELILAPPSDFEALNTIMHSKEQQYTNEVTNSSLSPSSNSQILEKYKEIHPKSSNEEVEVSLNRPQHAQMDVWSVGNSTTIINQDYAQPRQFELTSHPQDLNQETTTVLSSFAPCINNNNSINANKIVVKDASEGYPHSSNQLLKNVDNTQDEIPDGRIYKTNGNLNLNQTTDSYNIYNNETKFTSGSDLNSEKDSSKGDFKSLVSIGSMNSQPSMTDIVDEQSTTYANSFQITNKPASGAYVSKLQIGAGPTEKTLIRPHIDVLKHSGRGSCSPSASVGSTVRLADESDSGPSSSFSQGARNDLQKINIPMQEPNVVVSQSCPNQNESNLVTSHATEFETITVTLTKDQSNGLGIIIAGYRSEEEEKTGIFIKRVLPDSPAALSGQVKAYDKILSVNGHDLSSYSNRGAVEVLRNTEQQVTLELVRYEDELKHQLVKAQCRQ